MVSRDTMAALCLSCKLCCANGQFDRVPVLADEIERVKAHRLPVVVGDDEWAIPFPCAARDGRCFIYTDRPTACREYECDILRALNEGRLPEAEARGLLDRTNSLVATIRAKVPRVGPLWKDVERDCQDSSAWCLEHADFIFELIELRALLRIVGATNA